VGLAAITAVALAARTLGLAAQPLTGDDLDVAVTARAFVDFGWPDPTMWNHPRLRDLLVAASLSVLGDGPLGLKLWSISLGALTVPACALLLREIGAGSAAALLTAALLALDPFHVDFSRQGINDVYLGFFPVAALLAALRYRATRGVSWLLAAGALFGLGLASKWSAAFPLALALALVGADALSRRRERPARAAEVAFVVGALVVVPAAVYLATWYPWFERGYSLADLFSTHRAMAFETATHTGYPGTKLPGFAGEAIGAWRWFLRPTWFTDRIPLGSLDAPQGGILVALSNPLTWLLVGPALAWAAWRAVRDRDRAAGMLAAAFLVCYLPFAVVRRPIFANSTLAVLPYALALVGWAAGRLHERARRLVLGWLTAATVVSALLCLPAVGVRTRLTDAILVRVVPPEGLTRRIGIPDP
jgi:4-amino-4-deoxy-L-arabinose transferase-like glycosyltransferase